MTLPRIMTLAICGFLLSGTGQSTTSTQMISSFQSTTITFEVAEAPTAQHEDGIKKEKNIPFTFDTVMA